MIPREKGFTLIEMIVYIALIGVVVSGIVLFSISISQSRNKNYVVQEVQANSRVALDIISQRIRAATGVNTGSSTFDTDPGVLSLSMADAGSNPTVIELDADNGRLQITEGASSAVYIVSDETTVSNLVFTNLTPSGERASIRVGATFEFNNQSNDPDFDYSQSWQTTESIRQ